MINLTEQIINHAETLLEWLKAAARTDWPESSPVTVLDQFLAERWALYCGDSAEVLRGLVADSIGLVVTSLPFSNVYSYSPGERDLGNTKHALEFFQQFFFITKELLRVVMPGRLVCIHCKDLPLYGTRDGVTGSWDFPGFIYLHMVAQGFTYTGRITIDKDPQIPAKAYHPQKLLYVTLEKDSSKSAPYEADYVLLFRTPGENTIPIKNDLTRPEWVRDAHSVWSDIRETEVLTPSKGMTNEDERHLCPLQLPVIERLIKLYSNKGETVLDPFNGIGSVGYVAIQEERKYIGAELSGKYVKAAIANLIEAERLSLQQDLFSFSGVAI
jgi:DNA modification methylase